MVEKRTSRRTASDQKKSDSKRNRSESNVQNVSGRNVDLSATLLSQMTKFDAAMVQRIFREELLSTHFSSTNIMVLEVNQFLEKMLWPAFDETSSDEHVISMVLMVNEKFRDRILDVWQVFETRSDEFLAFFHRVMQLLLQKSIPLFVRTHLLTFLTNCLGSLEHPLIRRSCLRIVSLATWKCLLPARRDHEVDRAPAIVKKHWRHLEKQWALEESKEDSISRSNSLLERSFFSRLITDFIHDMYTFVEMSQKHSLDAKGSAVSPNNSVDSLLMQAIPSYQDISVYVARFLELIIDVLAQLPTRRYLNTLIDDHQFISHCRVSQCVNVFVDLAGTTRPAVPGDGATYSNTASNVFTDACTDTIPALFSLVEFYASFEIDDTTGLSLSREEVTAQHARRLQNLQRLCFREFKSSLGDVALLHLGAIERRDQLTFYLSRLADTELTHLSHCLFLRGMDEVAVSHASSKSSSRKILLNSLVDRHVKRASPLQRIQSLPVFPNESLLWHAGLSDEAPPPLALPKLNLQFLTLYDYVLRNFTLFRLESAYEVQQDIEDSVKRLRPFDVQGPYAEMTSMVPAPEFRGWARMAIPILTSSIVELGKPRLGDDIEEESIYDRLTSSASPTLLTADKMTSGASPLKDFQEAFTYVSLNPSSSRAHVARPSFVKVDIRFSVGSITAPIRQEWDSLRPHDVLFLITLRGQKEGSSKPNDLMEDEGDQSRIDIKDAGNRGSPTSRKNKEAFQSAYGIITVRGCVFESFIGLDGRPIDTTMINGNTQTVGTAVNEANRSDSVKQWQMASERTMRVRMDAAQYQRDVQENVVDLYGCFHILLRRAPQANNFKAILETLRDLLVAGDAGLPSWLHDVFLGYGDPSSACPHLLIDGTVNETLTLDLVDTCVDEDHLRDVFRNADLSVDSPKKLDIEANNSSAGTSASLYKVELSCARASSEIIPDSSPMKKTSHTKQVNAKVSTPDKSKTGKGRKAAAKKNSEMEVEEVADESKNSIGLMVKATAYLPEDRGPYVHAQRKRNALRFTSTQVRALLAAMSPGLTVLVGPPGTGKTDVAVQLVSNLYHHAPHENILLLTHSNQALNALFEKIMIRDIDERHLLRLGHGEESLKTTQDFSKLGRVEALMEKRQHLLQEVTRLASSLNIPGDHGATCETAGHFFAYHITPRWELFIKAAVEEYGDLLMPVATPEGINVTRSSQGRRKVKKDDKSKETASNHPTEQGDLLTRTRKCISLIHERFPLHAFFQDVHSNIWREDMNSSSIETSLSSLWERVVGCRYYVDDIFHELKDLRALELLRHHADRANYLLTKQARIIAMTVTHAALKRRELVALNFAYDTVIMEEAAQILEIETFLPLLLQASSTRLKRFVLLGDHHQLPPIIQSVALQRHAHLEQSLFTRWVRLGVPIVQLDAQGRARSSLASLYRWRYNNLGDLPHIATDPEYQRANPGFCHELQLINVEAYLNRGETSPAPHFYQNLGEAEFVVATYMYMRLLGYPAEKISILTTYNGQKHLLRDIVNARCGGTFYGKPAAITTVDKYQGQQNDYILLSLVRTRAVGHLRDVRRLIVAVSRARLGLYVFCRQALFASCYELQPVFQQLSQRPQQLLLLPKERYGNWDSASRNVKDTYEKSASVISDVMQMGSIVSELTKTCAENARETVKLATRIDEEELSDEMLSVSEESEREQVLSGEE